MDQKWKMTETNKKKQQQQQLKYEHAMDAVEHDWRRKWERI